MKYILFVMVLIGFALPAQAGKVGERSGGTIDLRSITSSTLTPLAPVTSSGGTSGVPAFNPGTGEGWNGSRQCKSIVVPSVSGQVWGVASGDTIRRFIVAGTLGHEGGGNYPATLSNIEAHAKACVRMVNGRLQTYMEHGPIQKCFPKKTETVITTYIKGFSWQATKPGYTCVENRFTRTYRATCSRSDVVTTPAYCDVYRGKKTYAWRYGTHARGNTLGTPGSWVTDGQSFNPANILQFKAYGRTYYIPAK